MRNRHSLNMQRLAGIKYFPAFILTGIIIFTAEKNIFISDFFLISDF